MAKHQVIETFESAPKPLDLSNPDVKRALARDLEAEASLPDVTSDTQTFATCNEGLFQLSPERTAYYPNGQPYNIPGKVLEFPENQPIPVSDEDAEIIKQILHGTYQNGSTDPKALRTVAIDAGLGLIRPGLASPPLDVWDTLAADRVVSLALEIGKLGTLPDIEAAIRFEEQRTIRTEDLPAEQRLTPRPLVLGELKRLVEDSTNALAQRDPAAGVTGNDAEDL